MHSCFCYFQPRLLLLVGHFFLRDVTIGDYCSYKQGLTFVFTKYKTTASCQRVTLEFYPKISALSPCHGVKAFHSFRKNIQ